MSPNLRTKIGVIVDLLSDFARLSWNCSPVQSSNLGTLMCDTFRVLADRGDSIVDVSPHETDISPPQGPLPSFVDIGLASRGLGAAGAVCDVECIGAT